MLYQIYIIKCSGTDYYKVGVSENALDRVKGLQTGCPFDLTVEMTCTMPSRLAAYTAEAQIHQTLCNQRVRGEWFELDETTVRILKQNMIEVGCE